MDEIMEEIENVKEDSPAKLKPTLTVVYAEDAIGMSAEFRAAVQLLEEAVEVVPISEELIEQEEKDVSRNKKSCPVVFVTADFLIVTTNSEGVPTETQAPLLQRLRKKSVILGLPAFLHYAEWKKSLTKPRRPLYPLYNLSMKGVVALFSGYSEDVPGLKRLVGLIHFMGGQVKDAYPTTGQTAITHLIARWVQGEKYQTAINMAIPVVTEDWVLHLWARRDQCLDATAPQQLQPFHIKPFHGPLKILLIGFDEDGQNPQDWSNLIEVHGGELVTSVAAANYIVVHDPEKKLHVSCEELNEYRAVKLSRDGETVGEYLITPEKVVVTSEWFWTCIKLDSCANPDAYSLLKLQPSSSANGGRSRRQKTPVSSSPYTPGRRRLSAVEERDVSRGNCSFDHSDESLTSSGSHGGSVPPPSITRRQMTVAEMVQTEANYLKIVSDILKIKESILVEPKAGAMCDAEAAALLDEYMAALPEILDRHTAIHRDLEGLLRPWKEDALVGAVWKNRAPGLEQCYPAYVNVIEKLKKHIQDCEKKFPKFRAHLALTQMAPEYGRQHLKDLLVRPVQRLASVDVLLTDIRKATDESNPDRVELTLAKEKVQGVLTLLNSEKQAAEVVEMLTHIEDAPEELVTTTTGGGSGLGKYLSHIECTELAKRQFHEQGSTLCLFLFTNKLEVAKRRYDPRQPGTPQSGKQLPLKHIELIPLMRIKRIVDVRDDEQIHGAFLLSFFFPNDTQEVSYKFACTLEFQAEKKKKRDFLMQLKAQVQAVDMNAVPDLLCEMSAAEASVKTTEPSSTPLEKVSKLTRSLSRRISSIGNHSSQKLKRAVSTAFISGSKKGRKDADNFDDEIRPKRLF
ncbi:Protein ECT2 [Hypsibius exemplaris]|uniref:Protein ECT2 n=1 Tax=Hypsibius exemplaris TaxID=2072580 RepID=A0A9X6NF52_HYPEX|nr:Protein ECT2 [Hypsibius exemplaris]